MVERRYCTLHEISDCRIITESVDDCLGLVYNITNDDWFIYTGKLLPTSILLSIDSFVNSRLCDRITYQVGGKGDETYFEDALVLMRNKQDTNGPITYSPEEETEFKKMNKMFGGCGKIRKISV